MTPAPSLPGQPSPAARERGAADPSGAAGAPRGFETAALWTLLNKAWPLGKGVVTVALIVAFMGRDEQGLWFTFTALAGATVVAELGFPALVTQLVSHQRAHLELASGRLSGSDAHLDRLFGLVRYSLRVYAVVTPLVLSALLAMGYYFFANQPAAVFYAWAALCVPASLMLVLTLLQALYQGLDRVAEVQRNIFVGALVGSVCRWVLLAAGFKLWALAIGDAVALVVMAAHFVRSTRWFWASFRRWQPKPARLFREIAPLQWRYAVSWSSGWVVFQLLVPAVFRFCGPEAAGQLGIALAAIRGLMEASTSWLVSQVPRMNVLVALRRRAELARLFWRGALRGWTLYGAGGFAILAIVGLLQWFPHYRGRVLALELVALCLLVDAAEVTTWYFATYLRAHRAEPYWTVTVGNAVMTGALVAVVLPQRGLTTFVVLLLIGKCLLVLPWATWVFVAFKRQHDRQVLEAPSPEHASAAAPRR